VTAPRRTTTARKAGTPRTPRARALKAAPEPAGAHVSAPAPGKTLLGAAGRHAAQAAAPAPPPAQLTPEVLSGRRCGWCGASDGDEVMLVAQWDTHSLGPMIRCRHVRACIRRAIAQIAQTAGPGVADEAPTPGPEQAPEVVEPPLEPLPEEGE
jgi:hypothetical protein